MMRIQLAFLIAISLVVSTRPASAQIAPLSGDQIVERVSPAVAVILTGNALGELTGVGSAVAVRPDGVLLTAYHVLKNAQQAQVRLKNGEIYDRVELIAWDERRDVAALRITASGLPVLTLMPLSEALPGKPVFVVSAAGALPWTASQGVISAVRLADEVPGAGSGYRLVQFTAPVSPGSSGGVVVDTGVRMLGLILASSPGQNLNFAVPIESVIELANRSGGRTLASGASLKLPFQQSATGSAPQATPPPIELTERERSEMLASRDPRKILCAFRTIYVKSTPMPWMTQEMLENALQKQPEFGAWGLALVRDRRLADLSFDVRVPAFTFDYHYTVMHQNTSIVVMAGKTRAVTGLDGATNVAKNFMKDVKSAGRPLPAALGGKGAQKEGK